MGQVIKVDFSKEGKELREMTKKYRAEKREPLSKLEKIGFVFQKQSGIRH